MPVQSTDLILIERSGTKYKATIADLPSGGGGGSFTMQSTEIDLGANARRSGKFTISGVGMAIGKPVLIQKAVGPYTGKGTRADEAEMDAITATGSVTSATEITAYWQASGPVRGNYKFSYAIGA
jgi:hypothetical protein